MSGHSACMPCIKAVIAQSDRHIATAFCSLTVILSNQSCTVRYHVHSYHPQLRTSGSASYPRATCTSAPLTNINTALHTSNSSSYISSTTSYATPAILCLRLHYTHISIQLCIVTLKHLQHKQSASQQTACQAAAHTSAQLSYMPYLPSHAPPSITHKQCSLT